MSPFPNAIALGLNANIYNARLSGHGCGGEALGKVKVKDWVFDLSEALEIGRKIGEKIIIIGSSTGGTLAAVAASEKTSPELFLYHRILKFDIDFFKSLHLVLLDFGSRSSWGNTVNFSPYQKSMQYIGQPVTQ